ncbi:OLC1v1007913C1 [Oldenlandia corymbosa var. corymbosa]|uniref:OLC1v1007913C1 n=1 Tax=Oldenlandia corymbosa var. corymbosa TaxID=529605 RepID=A0AAV1DN62_OLDCO|nr:OLC1v1007913C1 [Oldenlandia corymbosa var. corymbosa]
MEALVGAGTARSFPVPGGPGTGIDCNSKRNIRASVGFRREPFSKRKSSLTSGVSSWDYFKERDHLDYYSNSAGRRRRRERCGDTVMTVSCGKGGDCKVAEKEKEKNKKDKKQKKMMMKMEKRLKKMVQKQIVQGGVDLSISPEISDQINPFPDESKVSMMISDAAEKLLEQLLLTRAEEMTSESSSSSSSSESSDSDSDCGAGVVTDMRKRKNCSTSVATEPVKSVEVACLPNGVMMESPTSSLSAETAGLLSVPVLADECTTLLEHNLEQQSEYIMSSSPVALTTGLLPPSTKKVEVCMGGKCKKAGSVALLGEFQRLLGTTENAAVSGCKCMGKCRDGPNVRISDDLNMNALCIGIGLTDVNMIVENYIATNPEFGLNYA